MKKSEKIKEEEIARKEIEERARKEKVRKEEQKKRYLAEKERLLKKQKILEDRHRMLRWVTTYIDKNISDWEKSRIRRIENEKKAIERWENLARQEKMDEIMMVR